MAGVRLQPHRPGLVPLAVRLDLDTQKARAFAAPSGDALVLPAFQDSAMVEFGPPP